MYFVLKAVDKKINADGEAVEYLLQNEGGRQAWYKVEDIKLAIRNGQLIVQNLTLTNDDRLLMNFKKALDLEKDAKNVQEEVIRIQLKNIMKFVAVGYSISGIVTYQNGEISCPESMIDKLKDEISEYEERFKKRKPKTVINFLDEVVKEQKAQWLKTPDLYVIGNKSNVQMALADVILDEIRRKCGGIISSRVEAAQLFNSTLEEIMQSGSVDLSDEIDLNEIRNLVIEKAKPTMFKQLQGSWNEHGENKKYIDVDFKAISESVESGAKTFGAGAKRIGTSIKQGYDSIDKEELKKNLSDTISNLEGTLKMLNESEAAIKAKQAAKSGLKGLFGKLRQGE